MSSCRVSQNTKSKGSARVNGNPSPSCQLIAQAAEQYRSTRSNASTKPSKCRNKFLQYRSSRSSGCALQRCWCQPDAHSPVVRGRRQHVRVGGVPGHTAQHRRNLSLPAVHVQLHMQADHRERQQCISRACGYLFTVPEWPSSRASRSPEARCQMYTLQSCTRSQVSSSIKQMHNVRHRQRSRDSPRCRRR